MVATMFSKWIGDAICKTGIYDAHIELNGYPFLDNKEEYPYSTIAVQVMRPCATATTTSTNSPEGRQERNELAVIVQDGMSVGDIEQLLRETNFNGFPVVVSTNSMYLVGFVTRSVTGLSVSYIHYMAFSCNLIKAVSFVWNETSIF
ncbi:hypothetical protein TELCIR_00073 [Teladorsagia circumcincta]|uniref:CBS domain-containing protein n=1 Tax=Teladorsagia circumcincta TaxID=45464 RepID=A0A2G9V5N1_TELCI|nr:hypothetical protein TELCIR_00073 [Teladorsagia circumcincta]